MTMTTVERVVALHRVDLFADVPGRDLDLGGTAGARIIEEGAVEDHLFAIVAGRLRVHHGEQTVIELGPGATVGELAALVPEPRAASVTALEPTTLLRIDKPVLDELLADRPLLAGRIIAALVAMVRERSRPGTDSRAT